jgi:peptidoglycan/xylan/chitin deacetylase (PgdA/CDA1 family)
VNSIIKEVVENKHLGKGSIILMHNGAKYMPEALERVILGLKEKGYELVPISQLIHRGEFTIDHTGRQHKK